MRAAFQHAAQISVTEASRPTIQMKARIGPVDDPLEREADRVADAIVSGLPLGPITGAPSGMPQRKCAECAEEEVASLQTKSLSNRAGRPAEAPTIVDNVLRTPGEPLDAAARSYFEPRFGRDFSGVRVHVDGMAAKSADALRAQAYTMRNHIVFGAGQFAPETTAGKHLIAHELGHTIQQLHGNVSVIRCRPNVPTEDETDKVGVVSITTNQGSKSGQARLSDGNSVEVELVNNALPVGEHSFTPVGRTKGRTLEGNDEFMWRIPSDPITQELFDRLEPVVTVTVQPSLRSQFQELSPVTRELVTSPAAGRQASAEDVANAALAGQVLETNLTPDELLLLEVRRRESKRAGEPGAAVGDPLEFALGVVEARESAKLAAADNWSLLVLSAQVLAKQPIYIIQRGGLGSVLDPGSYDEKKALFPGIVRFSRPDAKFTNWQQIEAAGKPLFEDFQTILNSFEDALVTDLRNLAEIALDSAEASILRMDRQYAGIWQAKVWSPHYFWREVDKIKKDVKVSEAASERDRIKQQLDREQDEDRQRTMLNPVASVIGQPDTYSERTEAREKEKERQDQIFNETVAQRSSLKVTQAFSAETILAATTPDEAVGRLRDFLWEGRERIIGAREKIKDRKILYAADKIIEAEKAELKDPLGSDASSINMVIDAFAKYRKSQTSLWEDILKIIEFVAMFVPGPIGWGLRFGTAVLGFDRRMKDIAARRDLHGANLRTEGVGSGEVGSALFEAGINIATDVPVARAASAGRRVTTGFGREGSEDVGRIAAHGEGVKPSTVGGDVPSSAPKTPVEPSLPGEPVPAPAGKAPEPPSPAPPHPEPSPVPAGSSGKAEGPGAMAEVRPTTVASETQPLDITGLPRESPAAREASVAKSGYIDEPSPQQLRNEMDEVAAHPELTPKTGDPPRRRRKLGDHEWVEGEGGVWCRNSDHKHCVIIRTAERAPPVGEALDIAEETHIVNLLGQNRVLETYPRQKLNEAIPKRSGLTGPARQLNKQEKEGAELILRVFEDVARGEHGALTRLAPYRIKDLQRPPFIGWKEIDLLPGNPGWANEMRIVFRIEPNEIRVILLQMH